MKKAQEPPANTNGLSSATAIYRHFIHRLSPTDRPMWDKTSGGSVGRGEGEGEVHRITICGFRGSMAQPLQCPVDGAPPNSGALVTSSYSPSTTILTLQDALRQPMSNMASTGRTPPPFSAMRPCFFRALRCTRSAAKKDCEWVKRCSGRWWQVGVT